MTNGKIPSVLKDMPPRTLPLEVGVNINKKMPDKIQHVRSGVLGLETSTDSMETYDVNTVIRYLDGLDFTNYISEYYDCEDRAFWGVAHARYRFPGLPIGVASGRTSQNHPMPGVDHAVIIMWQSVGEDKNKNAILKPVLYDPLPIPDRLVDNFATIMSVIGFPVGDKTPPIEGRKLVPLNNTAIVFDEKRIIYPLHTKDGKGILDYLQNKTYNKECVDKEFHTHAVGETTFKDLWMGYDEVLWAFAHVRRAYPGCPAGVAIGDKNKYGLVTAALIVWHKKDGEITHSFWNPYRPKNEGFNFTPRRLFV